MKAYVVISDAVERGLQYGWNRVWKHRDGPVCEDDRDAVLESLENAVLTELGKVLEFDEEGL